MRVLDIFSMMLAKELSTEQIYRARESVYQYVKNKKSGNHKK